MLAYQTEPREALAKTTPCGTVCSDVRDRIPVVTRNQNPNASIEMNLSPKEGKFEFAMRAVIHEKEGKGEREKSSRERERVGNRQS